MAPTSRTRVFIVIASGLEVAGWSVGAYETKGRTVRASRAAVSTTAGIWGEGHATQVIEHYA